MIANLLKRLILLSIRGYQKSLSPDHGILRGYYPYGCCRFYPSCSEYTYQAVQTRGVLRGVFAGGRRLLKCNPLHSGGFDPLSSPHA